VDATSCFDYRADNFVAGNQRQFRLDQFAVNYMKIGPADGAGAHLDQ
jgi:hypothetical protein